MAKSAPQSSKGPIYDSQSFIKELARLKVELESARKSTETLRSYRESLPQAWAVDAGGRHYDVPDRFARLAIGQSGKAA